MCLAEVEGDPIAFTSPVAGNATVPTLEPLLLQRRNQRPHRCRRTYDNVATRRTALKPVGLLVGVPSDRLDLRDQPLEPAILAR